MLLFSIQRWRELHFLNPTPFFSFFSFLFLIVSPSSPSPRRPYKGVLCTQELKGRAKGKGGECNLRSATILRRGVLLAPPCKGGLLLQHMEWRRQIEQKGGGKRQILKVAWGKLQCWVHLLHYLHIKSRHTRTLSLSNPLFPFSF